MEKIEYTELDKENMLHLFASESTETLFEEAYKMKLQHVGNQVYLRGLLEISNYCTKDCLYCGIRKSNHKIQRYDMEKEEVRRAANWAYKQGYGSIVLQAGERTDKDFIKFVDELLYQIKKISNNELGITLSLGEQSQETYKKWFDAGAHRYLLRIETTNEELYKQLHPADHDFSYRLDCIEKLRKIGYQVGTGVMIGLPNQTYEDLVNDILFFKAEDIDMIGMGPYLLHEETPLAKQVIHFDKEKQLNLTLKMIALTRLYCKDINIASTTALQTLHPQGRELGLEAGANILMPNIGSTKYRNLYQLYDNKPCLEDTAEICKNCFEQRISSIGEKIVYGKWGDSPHFSRRIKNG